MKIFCNDKHWDVKEGKLILIPKDDTQAKLILKMQAVIEARVRMDIYNAICDMKLTENRNAIVKAGIDNVALTVQAMCADKALGYSDGGN